MFVNITNMAAGESRGKVIVVDLVGGGGKTHGASSVGVGVKDAHFLTLMRYVVSVRPTI